MPLPLAFDQPLQARIVWRTGAARRWLRRWLRFGLRHRAGVGRTGFPGKCYCSARYLSGFCRMNAAFRPGNGTPHSCGSYSHRGRRPDIHGLLLPEVRHVFGRHTPQSSPKHRRRGMIRLGTGVATGLYDQEICRPQVQLNGSPNRTATSQRRCRIHAAATAIGGACQMPTSAAGTGQALLRNLLR